MNDLDEAIASMRKMDEDVQKIIQDIVQKDAVPRMKQSPISFPVAKTSVATAGKRVAKGRGSSLPLADVVPSPSPNNEIESVIIPDIPSSNPNVAQIAEMSEMVCLPLYS